MRFGLLVGLIGVLAHVDLVHSDDRLEFDRDIAPLLKRHCVKCHGPAKQEAKLNLAASNGLIRGGTTGSAVVPHDADASLIWQRVSSDEMPPETPLSPDEKAMLKRWIVDGTPGLKQTGSSDLDHWSFRLLKQSIGPAPELKAASASAPAMANSALDRFLLAGLEKDGLSFAPDADQYTLIRRVSLDLTGLPPTPDAIKEFLEDNRPDAYQQMVERYLASPHFGERLGKVWLDAAGYADSNGYFNADSDRPLAYRYRDYVIRSLNADKPFDQFIREQIAGDEIAAVKARLGQSVDFPANSPESRAQAERIIELLEATHFLRNGQDGTGESDGNPDEVRIDRYTVVETTMQNVSTALLGLTIQCAKCHDHKFEPLTQRDYYSFQAVLIPAFPPEQWTKPNDRFVYASLPGEFETWQTRRTETDATVARLQAEITAWVKSNRPRGKVLFADDFDSSPDSLAERWSHTAPGDDMPGGTAAVNLNSREAPGAIVSDGRLQLIEGGPAGDKWLSTKDAFDWAPQTMGASIQVTFDLVENHIASSAPAERIGYFLCLHDFHNNSPTAGGNILVDGNPTTATSVFVDYPGANSKSVGAVGTTGYAPGRNYGIRITNIGKHKFQLQHLVDWQLEEPSIKLAEADLPRGGFGFEFCCGRSFVVDNVVVESFTPADGIDPIADFKKQLAERRQSLDEAIKIKTALSNERPGKISWTTDVVDQPPAVHVLERGNYGTPGALVEAGGFAVLGNEARAVSAVEGIAAEQAARPTSGRRLAFANWLTRADSKPASLMARVQVNRLWQHHFGTGLVATTDNFGLSGPVPLNRELLDWLANEFVGSGWSTKQVVRLLVNSAAYRQSSQVGASETATATVTTVPNQDDSRKLDPDGRRLSHYPVRRLDAEAIRDMLLAASGDIDDRLYGHYIPTTRTANGETIVAEDKPGVRRRSIYLQQKRTQVHSLLQVFDAPSIVFNSTRRPRSTMPLQSLSLLNSEFVVERARHMTQHLEQEISSDSERLQLAFLRTVGRPPTDEDIATATKFLQTQAEEYRDQLDARSRSWADLCQMLLVENAALYVE